MTPPEPMGHDNGKVTTSEIKLVSMHLLKIVFTAFPNPTNSDINFALSNYSGSIKVTLTDLKENIIHSAIVLSGSTTSTYKLNLKHHCHRVCICYS